LFKKLKMKKFKDIKIVACFMAHYEDEFIDGLLEDLSQYTNEFYVNLNEPSEKVKSAVISHTNTRKYILTDNGSKIVERRNWNQGLQRDNTIRLLDEVKPDIVLFPDGDEIYPKNLKEQLKTFWEDEVKKTFWFRLLYMWGDKVHFRNDGIYRRIHHVRAYKWQSGITYLPYRGYACPTTYIGLPRDARYHSNSPIKHYGYITPESRQKRFVRDGKDYLGNKDYKKIVDKNILIKEVPKELL